MRPEYLFLTGATLFGGVCLYGLIIAFFRWWQDRPHFDKQLEREQGKQWYGFTADGQYFVQLQRLTESEADQLNSTCPPEFGLWCRVTVTPKE